MSEAVRVLGLGCEAGEQKSQAPPGLGSREGRGKGCAFPQVDVVSRSGEKIPVSVWMKKVKQDHSLCCVVVLEPVERVSAWVAFQSDVSVPSASQLRAAYYVCAASPGLSPLCGPLCAPGAHGRSAPAVPLICVCPWASVSLSVEWGCTWDRSCDCLSLSVRWSCRAVRMVAGMQRSNASCAWAGCAGLLQNASGGQQFGCFQQQEK